MTGRFVTILGKVFDKAFICKLAGLREALHAFLDSNKSMSIMGEAHKLVLFHDAIGNGPERDAHVFVLVHSSVEVEVGDVNAAVGGVVSGEGAVDDKFGSSRVCSGRADVARVVDEVAANGEADTVGSGFLRADIDNNAEVGGFAIGREIIVFDEVDGFSALDVSAGVALDKAADFVGTAVDPSSSRGSVE